MAWLKRQFRFLTLIHTTLSPHSHSRAGDLHNNAGTGEPAHEIHYIWWGDDRYEPM